MPVNDLLDRRGGERRSLEGGGEAEVIGDDEAVVLQRAACGVEQRVLVIYKEVVDTCFTCDVGVVALHGDDGQREFGLGEPVFHVFGVGVEVAHHHDHVPAASVQYAAQLLREFVPHLLLVARFTREVHIHDVHLAAVPGDRDPENVGGTSIGPLRAQAPSHNQRQPGDAGIVDGREALDDAVVADDPGG